MVLGVAVGDWTDVPEGCRVVEHVPAGLTPGGDRDAETVSKWDGAGFRDVPRNRLSGLPERPAPRRAGLSDAARAKLQDCLDSAGGKITHAEMRAKLEALAAEVDDA